MTLLKRLLRGLGVTLLLVLVSLGAVVAYLAWPRHYPQSYRESETLEAAGPTLAEEASRRGLWVGAALHSLTEEPIADVWPRHFNSATPADALKWGPLLRDQEPGEYDFTTADAMVDFALERGARVRGHALVWGRFPGGGHPATLEARLAEASEPKALLRRLMRQHIQTVMEHFRGRVRTWDVVNEPMAMLGSGLDESVFYRTLGRGFVAEAFRMAAEADPKAELFLNERFTRYGDGRQASFLELVDELLGSGVPLHGIGIQTHVVYSRVGLASFVALLQAIEERGLAIELTEMDVRLRIFGEADDPYAAQGEHYRALVEACLTVEACQGLTVWGISDAATWLDELPPFRWLGPNAPLLFDEEMYRKPAYEGVLQAVRTRDPVRPERHPRLLFSGTDLSGIRARSERGPLKAVTGRLLDRAERSLEAPPIRVSLSGRGERDRRGEVKGLAAARELQGRVLTHSMAFLLTGEHRYRDAAVGELDRALEWPIWVDTAHTPPFDLMTGENALTFGLAYDWLFLDLTEEERARLREGAEERGLQTWLEAAKQDPPPFWLEARHNWNTVCNGGAAVLALAFEGESGLSDEVLSRAVPAMERYWDELGDDGGWAEGTGYWTYGHRYAFIAAEALRRSGRPEGDAVFERPGARRTGDFPLVFNPGRRATASFGDSNGRAADAVFYLLAREYHRPEYVWFQDRAMEPGGRRGYWPQEALALLWRPVGEPWLPEENLEFSPDIPPVAAFPSIGWAFMAPSQPDPPYFLALKNGSLAANHTHLDLNHVTVGVGETLLATELGSRPYPADYFHRERRYEYYEISTPGHNTVLVGGRGQVHGRPGRLVGPRSGPGFEAFTGIADGAYEVEGTRARRHVVFVGQRFWVLLDEIETAGPEDLELRFHTYGEVTGPAEEAFTFVEEGRALDVVSRSATDLDTRVESPEGWIRPVKALVVRGREPRQSWAVITVLYPRREGDPTLGPVDLSADGSLLDVAVGTDRVRFVRGDDGWQIDGVAR
jgi:endo-1,4-beta-xylanase